MTDNAIPVIDPAQEAKRAEHSRRVREGKRKAAALREIQSRAAPKRAAPQRTAVDAAMPPPPPTETQAPIREVQSVEQLSRVPRGQRDIGEFTFPPHCRKPGWDYQLITILLYNQPQSVSQYYRQGWRPVPSSEAPELLTPGFPAEYLDVQGMRWFWRPEHLSAQAREEDRQAAVQQQRDRMFGAIAGKADGGALADVPGVRMQAQQVEVFGEAGNYAKDQRRGAG